jgi:hypothetical protein
MSTSIQSQLPGFRSVLTERDAMDTRIAANVVKLPPRLLRWLFLTIFTTPLLTERLRQLYVGILPAGLPAMSGS